LEYGFRKVEIYFRNQGRHFQEWNECYRLLATLSCRVDRRDIFRQPIDSARYPEDRPELASPRSWSISLAL
jgi:hypothetical protein